MKTARWSVPAAAVTTTAILVAGWVIRTRRVLHFGYSCGPLSQADYHALGARPRWRERSLEVEADIVLRGLERRAGSARAPWVLYFPGNSSTVLAEAQRFLDALIGERDWGAVVWAYRASTAAAESRTPAFSLATDGEQRRISRVPRVADVIAFTSWASRSGRVLLPPCQPVPRARRLRPPHYSHRLQKSTSGARVGGSADIATRLGPRGRYGEIPAAGHVDLIQYGRTIRVVADFIAQSAQ